MDKIKLWIGAVLLVLFCLAFIAGGSLVMYHGIKQFYYAYASQDWPSTSGRITDSSIETSSSTSRDSRVSRATYTADIKYEYKVNDKVFKRKFYGLYGTDDRAHAEADVRRYPVGKVVTVYYDDKHPEVSLVERQAGLMAPLSLIVGPLFIAPGVGILALVFFSIRKRKKNNRG